MGRQIDQDIASVWAVEEHWPGVHGAHPSFLGMRDEGVCAPSCLALALKMLDKGWHQS